MCAELTQEALFAIRELQSSITEYTLNPGEPRIEGAGRDFRNYLEGLREIRESTAATALEHQIDALDQTKQKKELSLHRSIRRIPGGKS